MLSKMLKHETVRENNTIIFGKKKENYLIILGRRVEEVENRKVIFR